MRGSVKKIMVHLYRSTHLSLGRQIQAAWALQFEVAATVVAATPDRMPSAWLSKLAVAAIAVNLGDVGGSRRRSVVLARAASDAVGACGVFFRGWL